MIAKIIAYSKNNPVIFKRLYTDTLDDSAVKKIVEEEHTKNFHFVDKTTTVVHKAYETSRICFVTQNENEFYILYIIEKLMDAIEVELQSISEHVLTARFNDIHRILDRLVLNGKVSTLDKLDLSLGSWTNRELDNMF